MIKNVFKAALIGLLIPLQALGGLPPPTVKGQGETTPVATFNIQTPAKQATTVGAGTRRIETGNNNLLANPDFQATTTDSGWTVTNSTASTDSTDYLPGTSKALKLTLSSQSGLLLTQSVTSPTAGLPFDYGYWIKTSLTGLTVCAYQNSALVGNCTTVLPDNTWRFYAVTYPSYAGTNEARIYQASSSTGTLTVAKAYLGESKTMSTVVPYSEMQNCPTGFASSWTANTTTTCKYRQLGDTAEIEWSNVLSGAPTSATLTFTYPTGFVADTAKMTGTPGTSFFIEGHANANRSGTGTTLKVLYGSTTSIILAYTNSASTAAQAVVNATAPVTWASGDIVTARIRVPIVGWGGIASVVKQQQPTLPTVQRFTSGTSQTYTTPSGATMLEIEMCGGGGGGSGASTGGNSQGTSGTDSTFGPSLLTASAGALGAVNGTNGGAGGSTTVNSPAIAIVQATGGSGSSTGCGLAGCSPGGGVGGNSAYGGGGSGGGATNVPATGGAAAANTGAGGGGGGCVTASTCFAGAGGGAGGCLKAIIKNPSATYTYTVGQKGTGGTHIGSGAGDGGNAADGFITVKEYYGSVNAPVFIGSVTSNSLGSERTERAILTCSSSSSITSQSGSWISSIGNVSSGKCTVTIATGTFSATPTCILTLKQSADTLFLFAPLATATSATSLTIGGVYIDTGSATVKYPTDNPYSLICMGPR